VLHTQSIFALEKIISFYIVTFSLSILFNTW